jgi:hypothetical protein
MYSPVYLHILCVTKCFMKKHFFYGMCKKKKYLVKSLISAEFYLFIRVT